MGRTGPPISQSLCETTHGFLTRADIKTHRCEMQGTSDSHDVEVSVLAVQRSAARANVAIAACGVIGVHALRDTANRNVFALVACGTDDVHALPRVAAHVVVAAHGVVALAAHGVVAVAQEICEECARQGVADHTAVALGAREVVGGHSRRKLPTNGAIALGACGGCEGHTLQRVAAHGVVAHGAGGVREGVALLVVVNLGRHATLGILTRVVDADVGDAGGTAAHSPRWAKSLWIEPSVRSFVEPPSVKPGPVSLCS
mmetsp:Transcript_38136/g.96705  ORF Transcript_38136/g.96705 Transcript_38136/m.96705 type:complete len:258 (-) Transcript_38136:73-846(-)